MCKKGLEAQKKYAKAVRIFISSREIAPKTKLSILCPLITAYYSLVIPAVHYFFYWANKNVNFADTVLLRYHGTHRTMKRQTTITFTRALSSA